MCNCSKPAPSLATAQVLSALGRIAGNMERIADTLDDIADALVADDEGEDEDGDTEMVSNTPPPRPTAPPLPTADEILAALTSGWGRIESTPVRLHYADSPDHGHGVATGVYGHYHGLTRG